MTLTYTRLLTGAILATALVVAACSGTSPSMSPTAPTASASSASAGANFSPNPDTCDPATDTCSCTDFPSQPHCQPPPPEGTPCSPGYWKTHETAFATSCSAAAAVPGDRFTTCDQLFAALTCKGSDASCGRHEASSALNTVSGCVETD
ncbi:MAG TPA: hypothetical protein VL263_03920 [Vicinamibacterales bacterium]|nr:hypothetical protein [Vicinamibacterales bacterium]